MYWVPPLKMLLGRWTVGASAHCCLITKDGLNAENNVPTVGIIKDLLVLVLFMMTWFNILQQYSVTSQQYQCAKSETGASDS